MPTDPVQVNPVTESENGQFKELSEALERGGARLLDAGGRELPIPGALCDLMLQALKNLQAGDSVTLLREEQAIATQRAADLLGVSRPFLVGLLETGEIPFHRVGPQRRVYLRDVVAYRQKRGAVRDKAVDDMEIAVGTTGIARLAEETSGPS
jgi:excisionase family DNA binding protein